MHPELFSLFGRSVGSYGALVVLGTTGAILWGVARARSRGLSRYDVLACGLVGFCGGIAGAALLYVIVHARTFIADPSLLKSPGLVWYGGFAGGALCAWLYCRRFGVPLARVADAGAPGLALGHAVGRVGCFLGGCCYGRDGHPVQLYEAGGLLALSALVSVLRPARPGALFGVYLGGYALLRIVTEQFRGDDLARGWAWPGVLSVSQAVAMVALCASVLIAARSRP